MKVLVIKIAAVGDFLMATPALRALKRADREMSVHLLAGRSLQAVVQDNPQLDGVFYLNERRIHHGGFLAKAAETVKISRLLRREKFDLGLNFHRDGRFNAILFLSGCKRRFGFSRRSRSLWLTDPMKISGVKHHVFQYCDLLKGLGIFCLDFKLEFPLSESDLLSAAEKFLKLENRGKYIVLAMGGTAAGGEEMENRRWPGENFAALAGMLVRDGQRLVLLGGKGDARIAASIKTEHPAVVDLSGRATLAEAAALMKGSRLVVCNDSGFMHLADAVGARVIAIFGPRHPGEWKPLSAGSVTVWKGEAMECSPCCRDGVFPVCDHLSCLKKITPREIFNLINK